MKKSNFQAQPFRSSQCGQSCVAMITGKSLEEIINEFDKIYSVCIYNDIKPYLDKNGFRTSITYCDLPLNEINSIPNSSIIRFGKPDTTGHFIIKTDKGKLFDPFTGIVEEYLNHYTISHYLQFEKK
ncbi:MULTISPECIES: hypothetical protein [unclassified Tenacibaculum]|uniref:hypothetical protein n=1 Tax=unclassified Tenacibaculum TaxID=2635139 RepID=UPI001F25B349|nr:MULTISPECIES: hypothetical protein [unclassified Tenacibaculum]MCF2875419.1 hypothetical protein [Tenacibaculum sp. Cn5-1]MCF2935495.1 hypothetical protein [Tenacibaculum sp. Cn5-34]MCG7512055.1 hypothetical protein [Tenacibaculum sp. Cn5-46]